MSKPTSKEEKSASQKTISIGNENYPEKPKGKESKMGDEFEFRVIANAGDPGLTEDSHYDFLSRFLICMADPPERCPYEGKKRNLFYLVKRPTHLWIGHEGTAHLAPDENTQDDFQKHRRRDALGNVNVGKAREFVINSIPEINKPYRLGDRITAKITQLEETGLGSFFTSSWDSDIFRILYGPNLADNMGYDTNHGVMDFNCFYTNHYWHDHGAPGPAAAGAKDTARGAAVRQLKALINTDRGRNTGPIQKGSGDTRHGTAPATNAFAAVLHIYMIDHALGVMNPGHTATIKQLQQNKQEFSYLINADASKGGYIKNGMRFNSVHFEDVNQENRQRINTDECMPLVIASPNNFPTPSHRNVSGIQYMPAYAQVVAASGAGGEAGSTEVPRSINCKVHVLDNGDPLNVGGSGWVDDNVVAANIAMLNNLFVNNVPSIDISFDWDGNEIRTYHQSGTTWGMMDDSLKDASPAVDPNKYFNIWIFPGGGASGSWSTFPASHGSMHDGIAMNVANIVGGWMVGGRDHIIAHEAGHYLGLYHTWGDGDCSQDDGITDTPNHGGADTGCPTGRKACDGIADSPIHNFMNYTEDNCTNEFTQGQADRMVATLDTTRKTLIL